MAAGVIDTTAINDAVEKMLAESRYTLQERPGVMKSSIRVETLPRQKGPSIKIPKFSTVTTYALTEGVDMTQAQQITDTVMTLTPTEYGAQVILTDMMLMETRDDFFRVAGRILADSFDRQQDQTLCDDCDNFSTSLGGAGTALSLGYVMAAHAAIKYGSPAAGAGRGGEPGPEPITGAFTPAQIHALKKTLAGNTAGAVVLASGGTAAATSPPALERAAFSEQFEAAGVLVKSDINFNKDASDDAKAAVLSKESIILAQLGDDPSVEKERDSSGRWWELNFVGRWARGEYADAWGQEMLFDSASPSS